MLLVLSWASWTTQLWMIRTEALEALVVGVVAEDGEEGEEPSLGGEEEEANVSSVLVDGQFPQSNSTRRWNHIIRSQGIRNKM